MVGNNVNTISTFGLIYIFSVIVALGQHFSEISFGEIGSISWLVIVVGAIGFVANVVKSVFD